MVFAAFIVAGIGLGGIYYKRLPQLRIPAMFSRVQYAALGNGDSAGNGGGRLLASQSSNQLQTFEDDEEDAAATPKQTLI